MKSEITKIIRFYIAKILSEYSNNKQVHTEYITDCVKDVMCVAPQKAVKTINYNLSNNQQGLYHQSNKMVDNPCFVVAGGNSLKGFDFSQLKHKTTIVSNKSIINVPNSNYFITTDYTFLNWLKKENLYNKWKESKAMKFFVANCISPVIQNIDGVITDVRYNLKYELQDFDKIVICKSAKSVGFDFENFNSGYNSGFSSLQLAILLGYNPIYLLGFDMSTDGDATHYHGGYGKSKDVMNKNLTNYSKHFLTILERIKIEKPDLKIISCSEISLLNKVIDYKPIEEIL